MELKINEVLIGGKKFTLEELTCVKRDALLDIVSSFTLSGILKSLAPLFKEFTNTEEGEEEKKEENLFFKSVMSLLTNEDMWGALVLSVIEVLRIGPTIICLSVSDLDENDETLIKTKLTISQEPVILKSIIELNKLPDTLKNYSSLLKSVKGLTETKNTSI